MKTFLLNVYLKVPRQILNCKEKWEGHQFRIFLHMLGNNLIRECHITSSDAKRGFKVYGKDTSTIKGKTKRQTPNHIANPKLINLPVYILKWHLDITLCIDTFYINEMSFFHTISWNIQSRTVQYIPVENQETLVQGTRRVCHIYNARGFKVNYICADKQFECITESVRPICLKIAATGEHVPEVERFIQTIKSNVRTTYHSLPYNKFPPLVIKEMVEY